MRAWDGRQVMFKKVPAGIELEISQFLSSPGLMQEPHNHCVQLLEILELPDVPEQKLIVMPFLRPFDSPRFQTFGEFVSFFDQICDVRLNHRGGISVPDNPLPRVSCSCTNEILRIGAFESVSVRKPFSRAYLSGTVQRITSCSIRPRCILKDFIPSKSTEAETSGEEPRGSLVQGGPHDII